MPKLTKKAIRYGRFAFNLDANLTCLIFGGSSWIFGFGRNHINNESNVVIILSN